jgi:hypothetical protein
MALASGMCLFSVVAKAEGGSLLPADMSSIEVPQPHSDVVGGGSPNSTTDGDPAQFNVPAQAAYRSYPNYITMGIIHSPKDIDWKNAGTMMKSYVANSIAVDMGDAHSIGHVAFEVSCTMPSGRQTVVTGQTDYGGMDEYYKMLWRDHSYGAFFDYVTGALQDETSIAKDFGKLSQRDGKMAFVTILLSPQSCAEALKYMAAYQSEGVYKRYGLGIRPIYKEGGGCANYAASVLQVAGPSDFAAFNKNWSRTFYIPLRLIHIGERAERSVFDQLSIYDWSVVPSEPYRVLHFFDPDLMHAWVMSNKDSSAVQGHNVVKQYKINAASGFVLDYSSDTAPTAWWLQD